MRRWPREQQLSHEARVWALRIKGYRQMAIAAELGMHQATVSRILARVSLRVARQMEQEIAQRKVEQVAQLEHVAHEAMEGWERSKHPATSSQRRTAGSTPAEVTVTTQAVEQVGDPRFLEAAITAMAEIRKVLDMDKVPLVGEGGTVVLQQVSPHVLIIGPRT